MQTTDSNHGEKFIRILEELTLNALFKALQTRNTDDLKNLIHHSDQGVQYASIEYVNYLKNIGIQISMSRKGNPYDKPP